MSLRHYYTKCRLRNYATLSGRVLLYGSYYLLGLQLGGKFNILRVFLRVRRSLMINII
jgi:hypothetical protein